jgi:hypothetical protein
MATSLQSLQAFFHCVAGRDIGYINTHVTGGGIPTTAEKSVIPLQSFRVISYLFSLTNVSLFDCIV